jgi:flagellar hook-associated protein 3 FlgL
MTVTDNALTQLSDRLRAVRDVVVQARNGGLSSESQAALASNVKAIKEEVTDLYNTTYLDRPVFGGTIQGMTTIDASGGYLGNDQAVTARISSDSVLRIDVTGTAAGADTIPGMIDQVAANISSGGASDADLANIDGGISQVLQALGDLGARENRIQTTRDMIDSHRLDLTSQISLNEDVDMPQAMMNLSAQQVGYQAALQSAAKIQQVSLVDFLK